MTPEAQTDSMELPLALREVERCEWVDSRATAKAHRAAKARQVSGRRRFVDPTTCERDYNDAEIEFMQAMQDYKKESGRMFPTWSEVLEVLKGLGYRKEDLLASLIPRDSEVLAASTDSTPSSSIAAPTPGPR